MKRSETGAHSGRVETDHDEDQPVIRLYGECDISTVPELERHAARVLEWGHNQVVFDLENVTFMDSSILRILLGAHRRAVQSGGEAVLLCKPGAVRRLLELLEIDRIVRVTDPDGWERKPAEVH